MRRVSDAWLRCTKTRLTHAERIFHLAFVVVNSVRSDPLARLANFRRVLIVPDLLAGEGAIWLLTVWVSDGGVGGFSPPHVIHSRYQARMGTAHTDGYAVHHHFMTLRDAIGRRLCIIVTCTVLYLFMVLRCGMAHQDIMGAAWAFTARPELANTRRLLSQENGDHLYLSLGPLHLLSIFFQVLILCLFFELIHSIRWY